MRARPKVLVLVAAAAGLAFFLFSKPAQASPVEEGMAVTAGSGGGIGALIVAGVKKVFGKVVALVTGGGAAAATAGGATAAIGTTTLVGTDIALPAGGAAVPGAATGLGTLAATVGLLASPFLLGPPLVKLIGGKTQAEWEAQVWEQTKEDIAYKEASMQMAEGFALSERQLAAIPVLTGFGEIEDVPETSL